MPREDRKRDDAGYRLDMIRASDMIRGYLRSTNATFAKFVSTTIQNQLLRDGIERNLGKIGEAAYEFSEAGRRQYPTIPWNEISGMRQYLIHGYWAVDPDKSWEAATKYAPELARTLRARELKKPSLQLEAEIERVISQRKKKKK